MKVRKSKRQFFDINASLSFDFRLRARRNWRLEKARVVMKDLLEVFDGNYRNESDLLRFYRKRDKYMVKILLARQEILRDYIKFKGYDREALLTSVEFLFFPHSLVSRVNTLEQDAAVRLSDISIRISNQILALKLVGPKDFGLSYSLGKRLAPHAAKPYFRLELIKQYVQWVIAGNDKSVIEFMLSEGNWSDHLNHEDSEQLI